MSKTSIAILISTVFFLICSKNSSLESIELLIDSGDYTAAIQQLNDILDEDDSNVKANELRIRATMLQKSNVRNKHMAPADKKQSADVSGTGTAGNGKFSIMSLCGDGNGPELNQIQRQLNAKKVN